VLANQPGLKAFRDEGYRTRAEKHFGRGEERRLITLRQTRQGPRRRTVRDVCRKVGDTRNQPPYVSENTLNDERNNIHNSTLFCNSAPRDDREHVVLQLYGFHFQKISLELRVYPKKYYIYIKVLNALQMQLEVGGKKFNFWLNTFCRLYNSAHDLQGVRKGTLQCEKKLKKLP
jgi:hypothetical protein